MVKRVKGWTSEGAREGGGGGRRGGEFSFNEETGRRPFSAGEQLSQWKSRALMGRQQTFADWRLRRPQIPALLTENKRR